MSPDPEIPYQGSLRYEDYRRAIRLHGAGVFPVWLPAGLLIAVAALLAGLLHLMQADLWPAFAVLGVFGFLLLVLALRTWLVRKSWHTHKLAREPRRGTLSAEGLSVDSEHASARIPWDRLHQWKGSDHLLLVYESSHLFHILPRGFFAGDDDWRAATDLVAARLPSRMTRQARLFWRLAAGWLVLVAVLVAVLLVVAVTEGG